MDFKKNSSTHRSISDILSNGNLFFVFLDQSSSVLSIPTTADIGMYIIFIIYVHEIEQLIGS